MDDDADPRSLLDGIDAALADGHPLAMLAQASSLLAVADPRRRDPFATEGSDEPQIPELTDLLEMFVESGQPQTQALAYVMAHLQPDDLLRVKVTRAVDRRRLPDWMSELGSVEVYGARQTTDALRDGSNIVLGVRVGVHEMCAVAFIDFNMGAAVKDGFVLESSLSGFTDVWRKADPSGQTELRSLDLAEARAWVEQAIEIGAMTWPPFESDTWPQARPLLEWVLRQCPPGGTGFDRPEWSEADERQLIKDFMASRYGRPLDDDHRSLLESVIWFGTGYGYGDPLLISPTKIEILLLDWVPRKIMAEADYLSKLPSLLTAFIPYAHEQRGISAAETKETLAAVVGMTPQYLEAIRTPRRYGPEALMERMGLLDAVSDRDYFLSGLAEQVGGIENLDRLDGTPLPDETLSLDGIPDDIHDRVRAVGDLCDACCATLFDVGPEFGDAFEHRTAVRRLLHDVATGDPQIYRRRSRDDTAAAALCWLVGRANTVMDHGGVQSQQLMGHFGLTGSPSQRSEPMRKAANLPTGYGRTDLGSARYLTSATRRQLIDRRDRWREE